MDTDMDCKASGISTSGFFYPPLTPPATAATHEPLVPPPPRSPPPLPPHPYQTYAPGSYDYHSTTPTLTANSLTQLHPGRYPSAVSTTASSIDVDTDKASHLTVQPTYVIHHHHHHHHPPSSTSLPPPPPLPLTLPPPPRPRPAPSTPTRRLSLSALHKLRLLLLLLLFIPIPPFLSVLYLTIGHALLQRASSSHTATTWSAPLLTSANAGATGGTILALPLFLLLFLLLYPASSSSSSPSSSSSSLFPSFASLFPSSSSGPTRAAHEDFFDDDDDDDDSRTASTRRAASLVSYAACAFLLLGVGAAAGPLGVTCLATEGMGMGMEMLAPGRAAEAGGVGALLLWAGVLSVLALGVGGWVAWRWVRVGVGRARARRGRERGLGERGKA
ncbi:hypothetical protein D9615_007532 [Tricholomella constricta]|uniref:Uncharacterized protein n=1 Tax=Tricholomella constricta TaxID=117010 RepID=A0A8H5M2A7_9AGAR|nr:hypothetical protein D9615_007532 [Tricholomella constricta]